MSNSKIDMLLQQATPSRPSISFIQVEKWVRQGRKRPKSHLITWLSRIKPWLNN